ncbi:MAG: NfeD family protein [Rhodospirillales bacterium]|jgi:inner membrane protein|nr:NfeD family protein [Rhodospirillales bacterium]MBT4039246.1 NfeD family protein [Rhodospirillales bacterium]MBT4626926.1 NfeD family protein [Rhodospirillales bacterium]MBT5352482.1 NfeD family protein [Rhodospirillales bacterium]MBT5521097.1 NfeD family protein [Rhodospirillales bacterium]
MIQFLEQLSYWHWGILALVLIVLEIFAPGVIFLWVGVGAGITALIALAAPDMTWEIQLLCFAVTAVSVTVGGRIWFKRHPVESDKPMLNKRGEQYVGQVVVLSEAIVNGVGKAAVGDSQWRVSGRDTGAGERVRITGLNGATLEVEPE